MIIHFIWWHPVLYMYLTIVTRIHPYYVGNLVPVILSNFSIIASMYFLYIHGDPVKVLASIFTRQIKHVVFSRERNTTSGQDL